MTILFDDDPLGLFLLLAKAFHAQNVINTARGTTVRAEIEDAQDELDGASIEVRGTGEGLSGAAASSRTAFSGEMNTLKQYCQRLVIQMIKNDNPQPTDSLADALAEVRRQMLANSETVDASVPGATASLTAGNTGTGVFLVSTKRGDGLVNEHILAEDIALTCTGASWRCRGEAAVTDKLSADWPAGSGADKPVPITDPAGAANLLANGSFDNEDPSRANAPLGWEIQTATLGTTLLLTDWEVQTIAISGTPTSGIYTLKYTNSGSEVQETVTLPYNATQQQVQTALRALTGLELVEVVTTGASPDFTHEITFKGNDVGNLAELTVGVNTTGETITPGTSTGGTAIAYTTGKGLVFVGNGSQNTAIRQDVTAQLEGGAQYGFNIFSLVATAFPSSGVFTVSLSDGAGTVINDDQGVANSFTITATTGADYAAEDTWYPQSGIFRTPTVLPDIVYLRIVQSTAVENAISIYFDHAALRKMTELYPGGVHACSFQGNVAFVRDDSGNIAATNGREGAIHEKFEQNFNLRDLGLLLPTDGSPSIADSLIG